MKKGHGPSLLAFFPTLKVILDSYWCQIFLLYDIYFIDQVCLAKMAGYRPCSFLFSCAFMDLDFVLVHLDAKKELSQYPAILSSCSVNNA